MNEAKPKAEAPGEISSEAQPKWDYTSRRGTLFTGAAVIGLNLLVIIYIILDRSFPAIHAFTTGKPL